MCRAPLHNVLLLILTVLAAVPDARAQTIYPVTSISTTGSEILTATTNGTVYGRNRMVPGNVSTFTTTTSSGTTPSSAACILVRGGTQPPASGSRGTLTGDWYLDTGIINPGASTDSMTITFPQPIVNQPGPDVMIFEINAGTTADSFIVRINGQTFTVPTTVSASGWGSTGYAITSADLYNANATVNSISALESAPTSLNSADINQTVFGVALDFSNFGVASGASITSITITSTSDAAAIDPVLVAGLIIPPEQTGGPVIEELMADNSATLEDEDLAHPDWVEIYNGSAIATNLSGWKLSDDPALPAKWVFPNITLQPYASTYVFCSAKNKFTGAHPHTNFKLKKGGGTVLLSKPDGTVVTNITYPAQVQDISYGAVGAAQTLGYLETPTPGIQNTGRQAAGPPCDDPVFDRASSVLVSGAPTTTLSVALPATAGAGAQLRYLLDNNSPDESSPLYTTPFNLTASLTVALRVFEPGRLPSRVSHRSFILLGSDIATSFNSSGAPFTSNLPILVMDSYGVAIDSTTDPNSVRPGRFTQVAVYDLNPATGRASIGATPTLISRAGTHVRGQSSAGFSEKPYALEFWNEHSDDDKNVALLGMPADSDWVLQTVVTDKTFMRNYTMQQLMLQENGPYAGRRCRFVEVFFNQNNTVCDYGSGTSNDYRGIYLLIEAIRRGPDRVDVQKLNSEMTAPALITGGYIYKKDKTPYTAPITLNSGLVYDIADPLPTAAQSSALLTYLNQTDTALAQSDFANPASANYYGKWLDWRSLIERQIWQETCREVDSYNYSYYYSKDRGQPLRAFPFWDVDRSLGNANYGTADNALGFRWWNVGSGYVYFNRLFTDAEFTQAYWDRWWKLRQGTFATSALMARIEATAAQLTTNNLGAVVDAATVTNTSANSSAATQTPASRHFKRWVTLGTTSYGSGPVGQPDRNTYRKELDLMKSFLTYRVDWFDAQSPSNLRPPDLLDASTGTTRFGGAVPPGFQVAFVNPNDATGSIYYSVNGADPRATGGGLASGAQTIPAGALPFTTALPSASSGWKYLTPSTDPGTAWRASAFDDSTWSIGTTPIGYNESGLNTVLSTPSQTTSTPPSPAYFRKTFNVTNAATVTGLQLELLHDDGAVVFLNGNEVARAGMPYPPTTIGFTTNATGAVDDSRAETNYNFIRLDPTRLVEGTNTIAIEVHQALYTSTATADMRFDARLKLTRTATLGSPITLTSSGAYTVRARLLSSGIWSPITESTFVVNATPATAANIVISELLYHPTDASTAEANAGYEQKDFEFVELFNAGSSYVDLAGANFSQGVTFTFPSANPALTVLPPGERIVVVANVTAFHARFGALPNVRVAGPFSGSLDNSGETVTLLSASGAVIASFTYSPTAPWPTDADVANRSLVLNNPAAHPDYALPESWHPSAQTNGAPGVADTLTPPANLFGDDDGDGLANVIEFMLGANQQPVLTSELYTAQSGGTDKYLFLRFPRNLSADAATLTVESSPDLAAWSGTDFQFVGYSPAVGGTATVTYRSALPAAQLGDKYFVRLRATQ